jgi:hypothetical protein
VRAESAVAWLRERAAAKGKAKLARTEIIGICCERYDSAMAMIEFMARACRSLLPRVMACEVEQPVLSFSGMLIDLFSAKRPTRHWLCSGAYVFEAAS